MVKAVLLACKTYAFAMPNRNYRFSSELSLQNNSGFSMLQLIIPNGFQKNYNVYALRNLRFIENL